MEGSALYKGSSDREQVVMLYCSILPDQLVVCRCNNKKGTVSAWLRFVPLREQALRHPKVVESVGMNTEAELPSRASPTSRAVESSVKFDWQLLRIVTKRKVRSPSV